MKVLIITLLTLFSYQTFATIKCKAYVKTFDADGETQITKKNLEMVFESPLQFRLEADIQQTHFSLMGEKKTKEHLLVITEGPDYVDGVITKGSFNSNGVLNLGKVSGSTVRKVECKSI